jgi:O-antigen/teichoic acid export membrane protein
LEIARLTQGWKISDSQPLAGSPTWQQRRSQSAINNGLGRVSKHTLHLVSRQHVLALADQAVVSGTGFLTTIFIARWSSAGDLGFYALGLSWLGTLLMFQESLVLEPYVIQLHYPQGTPAERAGASLTLSVLFSVASILILAAVAFGLVEWDASREMVAMSCVVAMIVPFALARQFARRFAFAHLQFESALVLDLAIAVIQLATLGWLGASGRVSALTAWGALGGAYALTVAVWLYCARAEFVVRAHHVRTVFRQTWPLGRWLLAGQISVQVQANIVYWLSMIIAGAAVTGAYAACMSIVAFANPLLQGLGNTWMPRSALAWRNGGRQALRLEALRNAALVAAVMTTFSLVVLITGKHLMHLLYHGEEYAGHGATLRVLTLALFAGALGGPPSAALAIMERPLAIVAVAAAGAVLTIVLVWPLMMEWGLLGAAYGMLGGNVFGTVGRWVALFLLLSEGRHMPVSATSGPRAQQIRAYPAAVWPMRK